MITVTKPYLPSREKLDKLIDGIYERQWLTNNGQLVKELTKKLEAYLEVENLLLVSNGTLALQIAFRALGISDKNCIEAPEALTTPFTFIATASSLKWEGVEPVFVDIDPQTWCMNPLNIESAITENTRAIVPVHVFGNACEVESIKEIADRNNLKVVYDASHAFGVKYNDKSLLNHGDASTLSFHATKLFHTLEGGAIIFKRKEDLERARKMINFGITGPETIEELGINAKMNEFQAAMGLCVLDEMEANLQSRATVTHHYNQFLPKCLKRQKLNKCLTSNHAYIPVVLESEKQVIELLNQLKESNIFTRRYFYPSLDCLDIGLASDNEMKVSQDISKRVLCLPIYSSLNSGELFQITDLIRTFFSELKA